ncbi:hypothetical protein IZ6_20980 [Terrihabitans soli]|uniref:Uncharacterized protein n=1 Tax=Terrihabitans soli TaxID=708113 RepID=A0A6S6QJB6_9HYPH|nr:hypothetical protein [Terrihabitans soli]BCJ91363.1 hypothetical protein IZ6_20980 [Terrihabitans soli]
MTPRSRFIAARLVYPALFFGLFAVLPVALAREDKCTSGETAYMIAKRFVSERTGLTEKDDPDFPWMQASMVSYLGSCTHDIHSFFDRGARDARIRTGYAARVHYDVLMNHWSLEQFEARGAS